MVLKLNRMLKKQFIFRFLTLALCFYFPFALYGTEAQGTPPPSEQFVVVLDAGHGGKDPGNRGNGYFEKKIALSIALQIGKILEKRKDIKVLYTRKQTSILISLNAPILPIEQMRTCLFPFIVMPIPPKLMVPGPLFWDFMPIKGILK